MLPHPQSEERKMPGCSGEKLIMLESVAASPHDAFLSMTDGLFGTKGHPIGSRSPQAKILVLHQKG